MNFKKLFFVSVSVLFNLAFAQNKIMVGANGGIAIFTPKVTSLNGTGFKTKPLVSVAPTGFNLGMDINKKWNIEFSYGLMTLDYGKYTFESTERNYKRNGIEYGASAGTFKLKYKIPGSKKITILPYVGIMRLILNQSSNKLTPYRTRQIPAEKWSDVTNEDSIGFQGNYLYNRQLGLEFGTEILFKVSKRLYASTNFSYYHNRENYYQERLTYFKKDKQPQNAVISYGGSGYFIQVGLKWHWWNLAPVK